MTELQLQTATLPTIRKIVRNENCASLSLFIDPSLVCFQGHFDDFQILPGVVQVHWVMELAKELFQRDFLFRGFQSIKFMKPVRPGAEIELKIEKLSGSEDIVFSYEKSGKVYASGRVQVQR